MKSHENTNPLDGKNAYEIILSEKFTEREASEFLQSNLDEALLQEQLVINLSHVKKMDVSGLQTIILLQQLCEAKGMECLYFPVNDSSLSMLLFQNGFKKFTQNLN